MLVVLLHEVGNALRELSDAAERSAPYGLLRDDVEPDLDLVQPRGIRGRVVNVVATPGRHVIVNYTRTLIDSGHPQDACRSTKTRCYAGGHDFLRCARRYYFGIG